MLRLILSITPLLFVGCSSSTFGVAEPLDDSGSGGSDTSAIDSGGSDVSSDAPASDTSTRPDAPVSDVPGPDGAPIDSGGPVIDAGPLCPMPPNTKELDFKALDCPSLSAKYVEAVQNAQTCGCTADCSAEVCETFCCNCTTFVNPGSDAYAAVKSAEKEWKAKGCSTPCTDSLCAPPTLKGCLSSGTGAGKKCTSIHGSP